MREKKTILILVDQAFLEAKYDCMKHSSKWINKNNKGNKVKSRCFYPLMPDKKIHTSFRRGFRS